MAKENRKVASVGLFITDSTITVIQARSIGGKVEIQNQGVAETPVGAVTGVDIIDPNRLGHAIRALWRQTGLNAHSAAVAILTPGYSLRALRLPPVPESERRALVRGELEQMGALLYGSGAFGFLWIESAQGSTEAAQADVPAYYTSDAVVESVKNALQVAGLRLDGMEPASLAMMRAYLATRKQREPVALLCPAAKHTDLLIHDGNQVRQLRRIPTGWDDLLPSTTPGTRNLFPTPDSPFTPVEEARGECENLPRPPEEFESPLIGGWLELPPGQAPAAMPPAGAYQERVAEEQSAPRGDFLVSEVARTLAFYAREHAEENSPRMLAILGPAQVTREFEALLTGTQSIPVAAAHPFPGLRLSPPGDAPGAGENLVGGMAAVGTALAGAEAAIPWVDISRQEVAVQARRRAPRVLLAGIGGASLWLCLAISASIALMTLESHAVDESTRLTEEITRIKQERAPLLKYYELSQAARAAQKKVQVPAASILGRVAAAAPPGVSLTSLQVTPDGKVSLDGKALSTASVQYFAIQLGMGQSLNLPVIESTTRDNNGQAAFHISATFRKQAAPAPPAEGE